MTIAIVNDVISKFLANSAPGVLVLKGRWGVGKTYAWKKLVEENKKNIKLKKYCYISLFGISSISELKTAIFAKSQTIASLETLNETEMTLQKRAALFFQKSKSLAHSGKNLISSLPYGKNISIGLETIAPHFIRDILICFDDLERLSAERIRTEEVLGFISELKEEKGCKIVLIFNEDKLTSKDSYQRYREKVVDIELLYAPTPEEASKLALPQDTPHRELIKNYAISLGITNIRILRKIVTLMSLASSKILSLHQKVIEQAAMTIVLLAWCYYDQSEDKPTFEFIAEWNRLAWGIKKSAGEEQTAKQAAWATILQDYGMLHMDEFDQTLKKVVTCGYLEGTGFSEEAIKLDALARAGDLEQSFTAAWNIFHNSFDNNKDQLIEALSGSFKNSVRHISPLNLNGTIRLLRELGETKLADELVDYYVENRKTESKLFDLSDNPFSGDINDPYILKRFQDLFTANHPPLSLRDAVDFILNNSGWSKEHTDALDIASVDEFYDFFKQAHGEKLSAVVKACLRFEGIDAHKSIGEKSRAALVRIAKESPLNAIRMKRYGVKIAPPTHDPAAAA